MRVGANARQLARIKRLHAENTPPGIIAKMIQMTDQSLEKILAHLDGRKEKILAIDDNPDVQKLRLENAELAARLAKFEGSQDNEQASSDEEEEVDAEEEDPGEEVED